MANFKHKVKMIQYKKFIGGVIEADMVALFDERDFTAKEIKTIIQTHDFYHGVIMTDKQTYEMVFRSLMAKQP